GLPEWKHAALREIKGRKQRRGIVVIGGQHRAKSPSDHLRRVDPPRVASTANDVGSAKHNIVAMRCGVLRGLDRSREFRQAATERAKPPALFGTRVVVRQ